MNRKKLKSKWLSDEEIIDKYAKWCKRNGFILKQPSGPPLERSGMYAYLTNCNGVLARFNLRNHRFEADF